MKSDTTVVVARYASEIEAEMLRMALEADGIKCFVSRDDCGGTEPYLQQATGVRVLVMGVDAERAAEIRQDMQSKGN
jgi:hypothetical protein